MLNFPRAYMKSSTSLMEHTFLEQKPYGIMGRTLESQKSSVLTLAMTLLTTWHSAGQLLILVLNFFI